MIKDALIQVRGSCCCSSRVARCAPGRKARSTSIFLLSRISFIPLGTLSRTLSSSFISNIPSCRRFRQPSCTSSHCPGKHTNGRPPQLKDRTGSSRQALKKYVRANYNLGTVTDATFTARFNQALSKGSETGTFDRPRGASGPVKLGKGKAAPAEKKAAPKTASKPKAASAEKKTVC